MMISTMGTRKKPAFELNKPIPYQVFNAKDFETDAVPQSSYFGIQSFTRALHRDSITSFSSLYCSKSD